MSKLIALVDGSIYSKSVCDHAAWIAKRTGSPIESLHVLGRRETASTPSDLSGSIALGARSALLAELSALDEQRAKLAQKRGRAILEDARAAIESSGVTNFATKLRLGDIVEAIAEIEADADMVVIGNVAKVPISQSCIWGRTLSVSPVRVVSPSSSHHEPSNPSRAF
jgi:nucleotide-binding universal stress UspA family protein